MNKLDDDIQQPFTTNLAHGSSGPLSGSINLADLMALVKKFANRSTILFAAHPSDYYEIQERLPEYGSPPAAVLKTSHTLPFMGIPVWPITGVERGKIRSYKNWNDALNDLKDIASEAMLETLRRNAGLESELRGED